MRVFFWTAFAAMLGVYAAMIFWSLPELSALSGGQVMFDLRSTGYTFSEAQTVLDALGYEGRDFYQHIQHRLDAVYPALLALVLILAFWRLFTRYWAIGCSVLAGLAAGFDYLENAAVAVMLTAGPQELTADMVAVASRWTQAKFLLVTVALALLLIGLVRVAWRKWRRAR